MEIRDFVQFVTLLLSCSVPGFIFWVWKLDNYNREAASQIQNLQTDIIELNQMWADANSHYTNVWHAKVAREHEVDELYMWIWLNTPLPPMPSIPYEGGDEDEDKACDCAECNPHEESDDYDEREIVGPINRTLTIEEIIRESLPLDEYLPCGCRTKAHCNCIPF